MGEPGLGGSVPVIDTDVIPIGESRTRVANRGRWGESLEGWQRKSVGASSIALRPVLSTGCQLTRSAWPATGR